MTEAVEITTPIETPRQAQDRLRAELYRAEAELDSAKQEISNVRNVHAYNLTHYGRDTPENKETLEKAEARLAKREAKVEDLRAEMKRLRAAGAEEKARENAQRALEARAAKIALLSEPQTAAAEAKLAEAKDAVERARADHAALVERVNALKADAANQDITIRKNRNPSASGVSLSVGLSA